MTKKIKKIEEKLDMDESNINEERKILNLQQFMNDMSLLGRQVNHKDLLKPNFNYGDGTITNYLLWLVLGELMMLNNKVNEEEE